MAENNKTDNKCMGVLTIETCFRERKILLAVYK
jgi:hypothetical protein